MRIALAADHAGYLLKDELVTWLREKGHEVTDLGTNGPESVDYPEYGARLARAVASGDAERGIAVCGSGIGISIAVNRDPQCRCARVDDPLSAELSRENDDGFGSSHNNLS
jgi:ribose 5-phosphate isomerase B